jgi:ATP-dependent Lon protease
LRHHRKVARKTRRVHGQNTVTAKASKSYLGPALVIPESLAHDGVGVATSLAWTAAGGDVLLVEASVMKERER